MSDATRREAEAKFLLTDPEKQTQKLSAWLGRRGVTAPSDVRLQLDRYFDTADWKLYRHGWAYRWREVKPDTRVVCLKSLTPPSANGVHRRTEVEVSGDAFPETPARFVNRSLPDLEDLPENGDEDPLAELFHLETERLTFEIVREGTVIELCMDHCQIHQDAGDPLEFDELELELQQGEEKHLISLSDELQKRFGLLPAHLSKFERGLQVAGFYPEDTLSEAREMELSPASPATALAHRVLTHQFTVMKTRENCAWEGLHPEGVHQMRVASRRLRAGLSAFAPLIPGKKLRSFAEDVRWITQRLGQVRDLDVFQAAVERDALKAEVDVTSFRALLKRRWKKGRARLLRTFESKRYARFKRRFSRFLGHPRWRVSVDRQPPKISDLALGLPAALKRFVAEGNAIGKASPDKRLHSLRKVGKRLRYRLEIFDRVVPGALNPTIKGLKDLLELLGDHQDACVALASVAGYEKRSRSRRMDRADLAKLARLYERRRIKQRKDFARAWEDFTAGEDPKRLQSKLKALS